jgi:hypothetical protein
MTAVRLIAALVLLSTAIVHLAQIVVAPAAPPTAPMMGFGGAYLILAFYLFMNDKAARCITLVLTLIGLYLASGALRANPSLFSGFLVATDVIVAVCCLILIIKKAPARA